MSSPVCSFVRSTTGRWSRGRSSQPGLELIGAGPDLHRHPAFRLILIFGFILALIVFFSLRAYSRRSGRAPLTTLWTLLTFILVALAILAMGVLA